MRISLRRSADCAALAREYLAHREQRLSQVRAAVALLDEGSTVPFIARYRKEATGGLDDGQLRQLEERLGYLRELGARRETIRKSIEAQLMHEHQHAQNEEKSQQRLQWTSPSAAQF